MSNTYCGYQGFRPAGCIIVPSLKPGETYAARDNKYSKMGNSVTYDKRVGPPNHATLMPVMTTTAQEASWNVRRQDYRIPDRRGVSAKQFSENALDRSKLFLHGSVYENDYRNVSKEVEQLGGNLVGVKGEARAFKREFDRLEKGNGVVEMRDMPRVIEGALGREVRPWIKDRILKMFDNNGDRKVSWLELEDGLRMARESLRADMSPKGRAVPAWLASECKPKVTHGVRVQSCYQKDMGKYGEVPRDRRIWYKTGMSSTTLDLFDGTTKETYQVPGYGGFIPSSKINIRAREHGDMLNPRTKCPDLRLFYSQNTPGYAGHAPTAARNDSGPARCGSSSLTTSGVAALGLIM